MDYKEKKRAFQFKLISCKEKPAKDLEREHREEAFKPEDLR